MKQLETGIAGFPEVYVCKNNTDIALARKHGLPYLIWKSDNERLIKAILYHYVCKMLPGIDWAKLWKLTPDERGYGNDGYVYNLNGEEENETMWDSSYKIDDWLVGSEVHIDIEEIEALGLLPKFLADIYDCIKVNISDTYWVDGMNKKTGMWTGNVYYKETLPNLIILDVSGSIPSGISTVMLRLIDTIRHKCDAELIITATKSYYWGKDDEIPDPQKIAEMCGWNNEAKMFYEILEEHVSGRHFGHVFVFGDNDSPEVNWRNSHEMEWNNGMYSYFKWKLPPMSGTRIDMVHNFHTKSKDWVGYAQWAQELCDDYEFNTSWCTWTTR